MENYKNPHGFEEDCERWIHINRSGAMVIEGVLNNKYCQLVSHGNWDRLLAIIEDHIYGRVNDDEVERIEWSSVWKEYNGCG